MFKWIVTDVEPREDFTLMLTFAGKKKRLFDCKRFLFGKPYAQRLKDLGFFMQAKADHQTVAWADDLDIAPEYLYEHSVKVRRTPKAGS